MDSCWKYVQKPDIDVQLVNPQWILTRYAMNSNDAYITQARIGHLERIFQVPTIATASAVSLKKNEDSTNNPPPPNKTDLICHGGHTTNESPLKTKSAALLLAPRHWPKPPVLQGLPMCGR